MKYSKKFESDYNWYKEVSHLFDFDGSSEYSNKKGIDIIQFSEDGLTAKECFYLYDSQGKIVPTKEPTELHTLLKTKGSVNLHIQMYAEDRAKGYLMEEDFNDIVKEFNAPDWFINAVNAQKRKYYE